ncbi:MAG: hypothetical protein IPP71_05355 [Bacteroidetes bacterium]|nr:hypothetical protein [Bacteroidota bacterium]
MIYLTYNDQPSGVFSSQVNDVCNYINKHLDAKIKLVAIISLHNFAENRRKIRKEVPNALVLPALPKARYWQFSCIVFALICLFTGERVVISRNVIATKIALFVKKIGLAKKVCLDGRGAIAAEWNEYDVVAHDNLKKSIAGWEKDAVLQADFRIAVSQELVKWWSEAYGYKESKHVVIPCTLQSTFQLSIPEESQLLDLRTKNGYNPNDIILVYSGSTSGWQSFSALEKILGRILAIDKKYKLIFLSKSDESIEKMKAQFPGQISNTWLTHDKVQSFLSMCDYGVLYREQSVTNRVAAPTKFAEYLSAGLPVLISTGIGDYSEFVKAFQCGYIIDENSTIVPVQLNSETRKSMMKLVLDHYTKDANITNYKSLLSSLS